LYYVKDCVSHYQKHEKIAKPSWTVRPLPLEVAISSFPRSYLLSTGVTKALHPKLCNIYLG
jgi:hypothetical protein